MKTEHLSQCPSCGSGHLQFLKNIKDFYFSGEVFPINECKNCGLRFTQDRPAQEDISRYYDSTNYASHDSGKKRNLFQNLYGVARDYMLAEKFKLVRQFKPEWKDVLDYGTGEGFFTEYLLKKGKNAVGIEPSEVARTNFRERTGKDLYPGISDIPGQKSFQVITLWHVLEHIHDLRETMNKLVGHLEKKGIVVIAVPNQRSHDARTFGSEWAAWDVPRHLYHWDENSLGHFMKSFDLQRIYTAQLPLDPLYIGMISARYSGRTPVEGIWEGIKSYFHGRNNPSEGSSLLTIWMKK